MAQAFAPHFEQACLPHQYGLSTRAGSEALPRVLRAATEVDARATILSVDAVGAFDHASRQAMLGALLAHPELCPLLPFARQFYGTPSSYVWVDGQSVTHHVAEGEGGEQGDPLMPALYALAQQPVLEEVQSQLRDGEAILAYLDDTYIVSSPERVCELYEAYRRALWVHARIALNRSKKTRVWNAAGEEPPGISALQQDLDTAIWVGDWALPPAEQGLTVLGTPFGSNAYIQQRLELKRHNRLLQRIPRVEDLQVSWLLLHYCAGPRANYLLALRFGGLGLRMTPRASRDRYTAYWASWGGFLDGHSCGHSGPRPQRRRPPVASPPGRMPSVLAATQAAAFLRSEGVHVASWEEAIPGQADMRPRGDEPTDCLRG